LTRHRYIDSTVRSEVEFDYRMAVMHDSKYSIALLYSALYNSACCL